MIATILISVLALVHAAGADDTAPAPRTRIYAHLLDPREHPDYARRAVKPPSWETFGNVPQFVTLRGFSVEHDQIVKYVDEIEKYTKTFDLGQVIWPSYPIVFAKNIGDLADEIKRRGLFLFDIWGYVPGSGPGDYWQQYKPPREALDTLEAKLGDHWLGMDVGEQDGRYIGGYAEQAYPISNDRFEAYLHFQRHFEKMGNDLGNKLSTLVSLNFGHYFLKEGLYTTIGAEAAQGLPNSQVYYSFIRGAGKQYGVPWFGNASVFNRWGYKNYDSTASDHGPTKGSSLNLLKRIMYNQLLYNSVFVGFESGWFQGDKLSPIGRIQQGAQRWVREHGQPGTMLTPVALLFDFYSGWTFPRHLYTNHAYRVWGNIPYGPGDYLADGVLDMIYPGYQDSSYYHDERGFVSPTPYGDIADCVLSDVDGWLLNRYNVVIAVTELRGGAELRDKLTAYVEAGRHLVITAGNLAKFPEGLCGIKAEACAGQPAAVELAFGKGKITALASAFGIPAKPVVDIPATGPAEQPLPKPYPLASDARALLDGILKEQVVIDIGDKQGALSYVTCRKAPGTYLVGICNNSLKEAAYDISTRYGAIESVREVPLDESEKGAVGYFPEGFENADAGKSSGQGVATPCLAGGDVKILEVKIAGEAVDDIPHIAPPPRPHGRFLPLRGHRTIKEEILARPTFFAHYDGVSIDWRYMHDRDARALKEEASWLQRQGVRIFVDLASGINLYPDLRLANNDKDEFAASMAVIDDVLAKMELLGARDLLLMPNRQPENSFTREQTINSFVETLRDLCARAATHSITVYLRVSTKLDASLEDNAQWIKQAGAPNLLLAPSIALLVHQKREPQSVPDDIKKMIGLWLASAPSCVSDDVLWSCNAPIRTFSDPKTVSNWTALAPDKPVLFDVPYTSADQEYLDLIES